MENLSVDLETFSSVNLGKCGVYKYAESDDFEILLFGYSVDGSEVKVVDLAQGETIPEVVLSALTDETVTKWAFNAQFERVCLSRYLRDKGINVNPGKTGKSEGLFLNPCSWHCTMIWSATLGLPMSLESVGAVLGLDKQKLTEGKNLIKYFCLPCNPTKVNGGRTRNKYFHDKEKWEQFKSYNKRDVEVEMSIQEKLSRFPVPDFLWQEFYLDQTINDRGIGIDSLFVESAIKLDLEVKTHLMSELKHITGLENPNSVLQMRSWLKEHGLEMESLGKKEVAKELKTVGKELAEVLRLRQQLAKSSVKKYTAMKNAACMDYRERGMFRFYGANRTGRFAGRLVQLQNLPQNHLPDLAEARSLVKQGNVEALEMLYEDIPDTLSQLIRTAFIPRTGLKFIVADFSAIEARVLAWLAGEKWRMRVFEEGKDIYCSSASQMFSVPVEKHGVNGHLRQKGKIAELACIAEGELVLTDEGLVPIEEVTTKQKVWDGENWVNHNGVVFKGIKEVIEYEGLRATPDHLVWVKGKPKPIRFIESAICKTHLIQTGDGRRTIWLGENHKCRETLESKAKPLLCIDTMRRVRKRSMAGLKQSKVGQIKRVSSLLAAETNTNMARKAAKCCETAMHQSKRSKLQKLWCKRDKVVLPFCFRSRLVDFTRGRQCAKRLGIRSDKYKRQLRKRKYPLCSKNSQSKQQAERYPNTVGATILAIRKIGSYKNVIERNRQRRNHIKSKYSCSTTQKKLAFNRSKTRVYDIRNAGPNHRFTVSGKLVHNCGYGGAVGALKAMGALDMGLHEDDLQQLVNDWRSANPHIVSLWWDVDRAVKQCVHEHVSVRTHNIVFTYKSGFLIIELPSKRCLYYVKPRVEENKYGGESVTYEGVGSTKKWERLESYGPKFVENITQAIARDILLYAMQTLKEYRIVAHVHDEAIIETDKSVSVQSVCELMGRTPPWAEGLLLRADGYECEFYKKD